MHSKAILAVVAFSVSGFAAPVPTNPPTGISDITKTIEGVVGSPFGNGNGNGNGNVFGNGNAIGSGNNGISLGRRSAVPNDPPTKASGITQTIESIVGSPFGNGNGNGNGNIFGNGNAIGSGNNGISLGRRSAVPNDPPTKASGITQTIESIVGSPFGNGNGNGDGNVFGNGNAIGSGNSGINLGHRSNVRARRGLPDGALSIIPPQTLTGLNQDAAIVLEDGPGSLATVLEGTLSGKPADKRQVLTGLEDIIAQDIAAYIPK